MTVELKSGEKEGQIPEKLVLRVIGLKLDYCQIKPGWIDHVVAPVRVLRLRGPSWPDHSLTIFELNPQCRHRSEICSFNICQYFIVGE